MAEQKQNMQTEQQKHKERIVRILAKDIEGGMTVYSGLTKIKGISWSFANAICNKLEMDKNRRIGSLTDEEVQKITEFVKNPSELPKNMLNRPNDVETGEASHLIGADLDLKKEFDIKRLKKIKNYRGLRHIAKLTLRGQRTRGNFRRNKSKGVGIKKKKK